MLMVFCLVCFGGRVLFADEKIKLRRRRKWLTFSSLLPPLHCDNLSLLFPRAHYFYCRKYVRFHLTIFFFSLLNENWFLQHTHTLRKDDFFLALASFFPHKLFSIHINTHTGFLLNWHHHHSILVISFNELFIYGFAGNGFSVSFKWSHFFPRFPPQNQTTTKNTIQQRPNHFILTLIQSMHNTHRSRFKYRWMCVSSVSSYAIERMGQNQQKDQMINNIITISMETIEITYRMVRI